MPTAWRPQAYATSQASTPAITKHCATVSGTESFANQICGNETAVSVAASQAACTPPSRRATHHRPTRLRVAKRGATTSAARGEPTACPRAVRTGNNGEKPAVTVGSAMSAIRKPPGNRANWPVVSKGTRFRKQLRAAGNRQRAQQIILEFERAMVGNLTAEVEIDGGVAAGHRRLVRREEQRGAQQDPRVAASAGVRQPAAPVGVAGLARKA